MSSVIFPPNCLGGDVSMWLDFLSIVPADTLVLSGTRPWADTICNVYIDGLVQDCTISHVLAMEILQSCTKPSI